MQGQASLQRVYLQAFALAGLVAATLWAFWPGLSGPFMLDDFSNIPKSMVKEFNLDNIIAAATANTSGLLKRPIAAASFTLTQWLHGSEAFGFKLDNLILHLAVGLLTWLVSRRIFTALKFNHRDTQLAALISTACLLLHPLQVSTVLYAVQRMSQLSALFSLLAIYLYLVARQSDRYRLVLIVFPISCLLAVFSKENGALIPLFILAIEVLLFGFKNTDKQRNLKIIWLFYVATPLVLGLVYLATHPGMINYTNRSFSLEERLHTQLFVVTKYLQFIFLPNIQHMSLFHDDLMIAKYWTIGSTVVLAFHLFLIGLVFYCRKRFALISLSIAWFYVAHSMESSIFPLEIMFEHRNYLAIVGPALLVGGLVTQLKWRPLRYAFTLIISLSLALSCYERAQHWRSSNSLYQHIASNHPYSSRAHVAYAGELINDGHYELAIKLLIRAAELNPSDAGSLIQVLDIGCQGPITIDSAFYESLYEHYQQYPLTAYGYRVLQIMSMRAADKPCVSIDPPQLFTLLDIIAEFNSARASEMQLIKARILSNIDLTAAAELYRENIQVSKDPRVAAEFAAVLIKHQKTHDAKAVIETLKADYSTFDNNTQLEINALLEWLNRQYK